NTSVTGLTAGQLRLASHAAASTTTAATVVDVDPGLFGPSGYTAAVPPSLSSDGAFVAYYFAGTDLGTSQGGTAGAFNVFRYDVFNNSNTLVSHAAGSSTTAGDNPSNANQYEASGPAISSDGSFIAYTNNSTNLLSTTSPLTGQNGRDNVYL